MDSYMLNETGFRMYHNYLPSSLTVPLTTILAIIMILGTVGNTCVVIIFKPNRQPVTAIETVNNFLLYHLAIADLVNCLVNIPAEMIEFNTFGKVRHYICQVVMATSMICGSLNCYIMILLSFERYMAVRRKPLIIKSHQLHPRRRLKIYYISIIGCWMLSCSMSISTLLKLQYEPQYLSCLSIMPGDPYHKIAVQARKFAIPLLAWNSFLFIVTLTTATTSFAYIRHIIAHQEQRQSTLSLQRSVLQVASAVIGIFLLSYGPVIIMGTVPQGYNSLTSAIVRSTSVTATNIRSFTNPIIYYRKHRKFRDRLRKVLYCHQQKQIGPEISHTSGLVFEHTVNIMSIESHQSVTN